MRLALPACFCVRLSTEQIGSLDKYGLLLVPNGLLTAPLLC